MNLWHELKVKHNQPMTRRAAWIMLAVLAALIALFAVRDHFFPQGG